MITAQILCDSTGSHSPRLTTFFATFHKFILAERNTHRALSRSDRSSRAVPTKILIEEVLDDPAMPVEFHRRKSGMGGGELLVGEALKRCQDRWKYHSSFAAWWAQEGLDQDESKETLNRHLDQFTYTHSVMTATEPGWLNFFGLRLNPMAQPEIRVLAEIMWEKWNENVPDKLEVNSWHLPMIDDGTLILYMGDKWVSDHAFRISAARCARTTYLSLMTQKPSTVEEDLRLANRLLADRHLSPFEHQATPDTPVRGSPREPGDEGQIIGFYKPHLHGNLPGWIQFRKTIPGEAIAPLPEGYSYIRTPN
jgi:Thymidylate synthase complementing protein